MKIYYQEEAAQCKATPEELYFKYMLTSRLFLQRECRDGPLTYYPESDIHIILAKNRSLKFHIYELKERAPILCTSLMCGAHLERL